MEEDEVTQMTSSESETEQDVQDVVNNNDSSSEDSSSDSDSSDSDDSGEEMTKKKRPFQYAFTITENIYDDENDDEEEDEQNNNEDGENSDEEDERLITAAASSNKSNSSEPPMKKPRLDLSEVEVKEPKFVKPFDYEQLRQEQNSRGVIFMQKPDAKDLEDKFGKKYSVNKFFSEFGKITRIAPEFEHKKKYRRLVGFYIEYEDKNIAKRVALSVNGAPISRRDSRTLSVRYMPNFSWGSIGQEEERKKLLSKMLQMEAEKELRLVKGYKQNSKMPEKNRKKLKTFKFKQHKFKKYTQEKNHHLYFMPIFDSSRQSSDEQKK